MATRTAATRRQDEKAAYDVFLASCPTRQLLDTLGSKWVSLIIALLDESPHRYNAIARHVPGVSPKMLTQTLRGLERDGLVRREVTVAVPVRVEYSLTDLGRSLVPVVRAVQGWAEEHMDDIAAARVAHDRRAQT